MDETSLSLLDRLQQADKSATWDRLVVLYTPLLRAWLRKYEVQSSDADDLVQEVLIAVSRDVCSFQHNGRPGAFRSWLRTILVNRLRAFWKSRRNRPMASGSSSLLERLEQLEDETSIASRLWDAEHDRHVMTQLLDSVRPRFQDSTWEAFRRQMFRGEKGRDVAAELGLSLKAVQLAKSRVLNALRTEAAGLIDC